MAKTYEAYKGSSIDWLPLIPQNWQTMRLKNVGFLYGGLTGKSGDDFNVDDDEESYMFFIPFTNIFNNTIINPNQLYKVKVSEEENQNLVKKDDIFFLMSSEDYEGIGKSAILEENIENLGLNSFCKGLRITNENICAKYLLYYLSSHIAREQIKQEAKGFIRINLRQDRLQCCKLIFPSSSEQQAIASFLDNKCGEIDSLIALQEEMIGELQAYKQSVITEAVTKGLDHNVKMKDSGVEWIGDVPQHWEVKMLKYVFNNMDYLRQPIAAEQRQRTNPQYDYYGASGVIDKIDFYNVDDTVLLIGEDGANLRMRNLPLIYKASGKNWVNNHAHILKPKVDNYNYLAHILESVDYTRYITGSAQPKLSQSNLSAVKICIPPLSEQQSIATYLDTKTSQIDSLISIKQEKIAELKDYKKSIIYEYVTGKKRV